MTAGWWQKQADQARVAAQVAGLQAELARLGPAQLDQASREADIVVTALAAQRDLTRTIVHVDMDMFYAAVEVTISRSHLCKWKRQMITVLIH